MSYNNGWVNIKGYSYEAIYQEILGQAQKLVYLDPQVDGWCRKLAKECLTDGTSEFRLSFKSRLKHDL